MNLDLDTVFSRLKMAESGGRHLAKDGGLVTSKVGAQGITQLMPKTSANPGYGIKPRADDSQAEFERVGREYLQAMHKEFGGDWDKALAAYNAGPGNLNRALSKANANGGSWRDYLPKPEETLPYIDKILGTNYSKAQAAPKEQQAEQVTAQAAGVKPFGPIKKDIKWESLREDPSWLDASELMYRLYNKRPPQEEFKTDAELADWGLQFMADVDWSLITLGRVSNKLGDLADPETKAGLAYMLDTFDNVDTSAAGVWRGLKAFGTDPLNFVGLGTFGVGTAGKAAAQAGAKLAFRQALKQSLGRAGVIAGIEGMIFTGVDDNIRQGIEVQIGKREERNYLESAAKIAVGGAAGAAFGTVFDMAATKIARAWKGRRGALEVEAPPVAPEAAPGATPGAKGAKAKPTNLENLPVLTERVDPNLNDLDPKKLKGRRPEDDILVGPEGLDTASLRSEGLRLDAIKTGLRNTPQNVKLARDLAFDLAEQIRGMNTSEVEVVVEALRRTEMTLEEHKNLAVAVQMAADSLKVERADLILKIQKGALKDAELEAALIRQAEIDKIIVPIELADEAFSSQIGSMLNSRKAGLTDLRGISVETVMQQFPDLTREQAEAVYANKVLKAAIDKKASEVRQQFGPEIDRLVDSGDWKGAVEALGRREEAVSQAAHDLLPEEMKGMSNFAQYGSQHQATLSEKFNELAISNVFSFTTLMVNAVPSTIKVLVQPGIKALMSNPLEKATRIEMAANYSAMKAAFTTALQAAKVSWKYEQALLTRDTARLMEGELAIRGKNLAGLIRAIPRTLNASDEFLSHAAYNGYVGGKRAAEAYTEGIAQGMDDKAATKYAKEQMKLALENAYKQHDIEARIKPIVNKGINMNLTGKELDDYVMKEARANLQHIKHGTDEAALDYVRDILYKRQFGDGTLGTIGKAAEQFMMKMPALKWATGQLFFRTPIRVIEEGLRYTPGIQMAMPNFLPDLAGKHGPQRQAMAQGQAMMSLAFAGAALMMYAEGNIVGAGPTDYRQRKLRQDSDLPDPYTIKDKDGDTWTYRSFDPIATPLKILVTSFEKLDDLKIREAQGEFIGADVWKKAQAQLSAAVAPIVLAISDANLFAGITNTTKLVAGLENLEGDHNGFVKYIGERLRWLIPNTLHKELRAADPTLADPVSLAQTVRTQFWVTRPLIEEGAGIKTSKSYDILGNPRTITDVGSLRNIFSVATPEERAKGRSEEELAVLREMDRLGRVTGTTFSFGYKHQMTGDLDLRTVMTKDGSKTLFDKWNETYRSLDPVSALYPIVTAPLPDGTFKHKAAKTEAIQQVLRQYRDAAFQMMLTEEGDLMDRYLKERIKEGQDRAGLFDSGRTTAAPQMAW